MGWLIALLCGQRMTARDGFKRKVKKSQGGIWIYEKTNRRIR
jgi:hypothetical protein